MNRIDEIKARSEAAQKAILGMHQEMLDIYNGDFSDRDSAWFLVWIAEWFNTIKQFWPFDDISLLLTELDRLTEALEVAKRGYVDCMSAERQADGKCLGYGRGENDDEPCAQCMNCPQCTAYEPEMKTINEWAALDGIVVLDPDGFDRSDPYVLEKEVTKTEYLAGIARCTIMPLPAAIEKGE